MLNETEESWLHLFHAIIVIVVLILGITFFMTGSVSHSLDNVANAPEIARDKAIKVGTDINNRVTQPIVNGVNNDMNI